VGALAVDYVWQVCAEGEATVMALTSARYVVDIAVHAVQVAARRRQGRGAAKEGGDMDGKRAGGFKGPMAYLAPLADVPYEDIISQAARVILRCYSCYCGQWPSCRHQCGSGAHDARGNLPRRPRPCAASTVPLLPRAHQPVRPRSHRDSAQGRC